MKRRIFQISVKVHLLYLKINLHLEAQGREKGRKRLYLLVYLVIN
jgi:hypothetical protein